MKRLIVLSEHAVQALQTLVQEPEFQGGGTLYAWKTCVLCGAQVDTDYGDQPLKHEDTCPLEELQKVLGT